jgi:hypothetical protein
MLKIKRVATGAVLYNGEQQFNVRGVRIFNPFLARLRGFNLLDKLFKFF